MIEIGILYFIMAIKILAMVILLSLVLPKMIQEARIKDGIYKLRIAILILHLIYIFSIFISVVGVGCRLSGCSTNAEQDVVSLIRGSGYLASAIIIYWMYSFKVNERKKVKA